MEDDIDIEEHDVLDNPKIRDIFPDLSLVKTEVPDEDVPDQYEESQEYELQLEYPCTVKNEVVSDEEATNYDYGQSEESTSCAYELSEQRTSCVYEQNLQTISCEFEHNEGTYEHEQNERSVGAYEHVQNERIEGAYENEQIEESEGIYEHEQIGDNSCEFEQSDQSNDEFQYSNKIILGSKPMIDYEVLYKEALHSTVSVFLENWDFKLKTSPCYCQSCETLFPTVNALDAHNSISHSFLVALDIPRPNTARKSTVNTSSRYCNHCDKNFPNDTALIKHLYELLPLKDFQKPTPQPLRVKPTPQPLKVKATPQPLEVDSKLVQFKCIKCKKYFKTLADGKRHKKLAHPAMANVNLIVRVLSTVDKPTPLVSAKTSSDSKAVEFSSSLVPKSLLFQCPHCQLNFLSCYSTLQHSNKCEKILPLKLNKNKSLKCQTCKRQIRKKDVQVHELQHKVSAKLKIYTVHRNMLEKVLLKCPKCLLCYDERLFWYHWKTCDGEENSSTRCHICSIDIIQSKYEIHKALHTSKKYTKKDFIVVEFCDTSYMMAPSEVQWMPTAKSIDTDITVYYCACCGSHLSIYTLRWHTDGTCKNFSVNYCEFCGLGFGKNTMKQHLLLHSKKNITLSDIKVISLSTKQHMEPPIPNFHRCLRCNIHFLTRDKCKHHKCDTEAFQVCDICNKKFNLKAMLPHSNFHTYKCMPELLKKYNSINNIWNVIYLCGACDLISPTYDSAVEHCQLHINDFKRPSTKFCQICEFDIIEKCFNSHMNLHINNEDIDRSKFTILKYNHKHLFDAEWMNVLSPLPKQHKFHILTKSIYRYSRRFKLNVEINCNTDDMKFFCKRCKVRVNPQDIKQHYYEKKCKNSTKYICNTCNLKFPTLRECITHEDTHEKVSKTYKIITFNDQKDELFDQRLKDYDLIANKQIKPPSKNIKPPSKNIKPLSKNIKPPMKTFKPPIKTINKKVAMKLALNKKAALKKVSVASKIGLIASNAKQVKTAKADTERTNRIKLYKCSKCQQCLSVRSNMFRHTCTTFENRIRLCKICNEYFYNRHLHLHMELHKTLPKLPKKPLIIYFNPGLKTLPIATVFQCECGLHFTTKLSIDNHLNICSEDLAISQEMCSKCNLLFPTDVLVSHLCKHHSKPVDIKVERVTNTKTKPYMCANCKTVYLTRSSFEEHLFKCPVKNCRHCPKCEYSFDQTSYRSHPCVKDQEMIVVKNTASVIKMYRCHQCNITYLFRKSYDYHLVVQHVSHREIVNCSICKLRFTGQSINKHMEMHDPDEKYIIKVIEPETRNSCIIKGRNFKLDCVNKSTKRKDSALNTDKKAAKTPKKSVEDVDMKEIDIKPIYVADKNISPKAVDQKMAAKSDDKYTVYICATCDICFLHKRRIDYHKEVGHVARRTVKPCKVCGLRFLTNVLLRHEFMHYAGDTYTINIKDVDAGKTTVVTGKNLAPKIVKSNKRRSRFNDDNALAKKTKVDGSESDSGANFADVKDNIVDQIASTSKFDFESVNMNEEDTTTTSNTEDDNKTDNITNDPLNNSSELIVPDVTDNSFGDDNFDKNYVSGNLRKILDASFDSYSNNICICTLCDLHFLTAHSYICHMKRTNHDKRRPEGYNCEVCDLKFSKMSLPRHVYVHHTRMNLNDVSLFNIIDMSNDKSIVKSLTKDRLSITAADEESEAKTEGKIVYFKCSECNVCFLDDNHCRRHTSSHVSLDPMSYIECKICNFQFLIDSLKKHMNLHHSTEFNLEDLVVTEYTPTGDRQPKVDVYRGIDKVQSRLVSTTTDMTVDSTEGDIVGV